MPRRRVIGKRGWRGLLLLCALAATWWQAQRLAVGPALGQEEADLVGQVKREIRALEPSGAELAFRRIGWLDSLTEAQRLAREHGLPLFLLTASGRLDRGRC